ncbi:hypothetical protein [Streptococcus ferus]|uniref:hypothetical protein n=1 Tax=Streptococcus ferus TaxID=1345 RepID=UPI0023534663|nr:hypothetical protein [Streptococcus ferus]
MKDFFKDNKYFAVYLVGSLVSVFSLFRAGHLVFGLLILLFVILLFTYLYHLSQR